MTTAFMNFGQTLGEGIAGRENDRDGSSREVHLSDGMTVRLESRDPYGHWYIVWGKGAVPDPISGAYTHPEQAFRALTQYLSVNKYDTKVVDEKVTIPEIQYKKVKKVA